MGPSSYTHIHFYIDYSTHMHTHGTSCGKNIKVVIIYDISQIYDAVLWRAQREVSSREDGTRAWFALSKYI